MMGNLGSSVQPWLVGTTFPMEAETKVSLEHARLRSQVYRSWHHLSLFSISRCHTEEDEAWRKLAELSFIAQYWSHLFR